MGRVVYETRRDDGESDGDDDGGEEAEDASYCWAYFGAVCFAVVVVVVVVVVVDVLAAVIDGADGVMADVFDVADAVEMVDVATLRVPDCDALASCFLGYYVVGDDVAEIINSSFNKSIKTNSFRLHFRLPFAIRRRRYHLP